MDNEKRKLLEKNIDIIKGEIKVLVFRMTSNSYNETQRNARNEEYFEIASSFIMDAMSTYDPNKTDESKMHLYIGRICIWRLIDVLRKRQKRVNKDSQESRYKTERSTQMKNIPVIHKDFSQIDWEDFKSNIIKRADKQFVVTVKKDGSLDESDLIYKTIIYEYVIPKCEGSDKVKLEDLGKKFDLTESRMSQILHSDKMKNFVKSCYGKDELD